MTTAAFFGYLFLSCGPPLAAGLPFFFHRSMLSLTTITSMFAWLAIIIFVSAIFRAFVPLDRDALSYLPLLLVTVTVEEVARIGFWFLHKSAGIKLKQLAANASVRYSPLDELALAYAIGWGHGFTHLLFQFGPFLPLTWYTATAYSSKCPNLSVFLVSCLTQLGMFAILAGMTCSASTMHRSPTARDLVLVVPTPCTCGVVPLQDDLVIVYDVNQLHCSPVYRVTEGRGAPFLVTFTDSVALLHCRWTRPFHIQC